jgi:hypothetical protein
MKKWNEEKGERPRWMDMNECTVGMWLWMYEKDKINKKDWQLPPNLIYIEEKRKEWISFDHCLHRNILLTINNLLPGPSAISNTNHTLRLKPSPEGGWPKDVHHAMLYAGV